jgi:hypothetical protein
MSYCVENYVLLKRLYILEKIYHKIDYVYGFSSRVCRTNMKPSTFFESGVYFLFSVLQTGLTETDYVCESCVKPTDSRLY